MLWEGGWGGVGGIGGGGGGKEGWTQLLQGCERKKWLESKTKKIYVNECQYSIVNEGIRLRAQERSAKMIISGNDDVLN